MNKKSLRPQPVKPVIRMNSGSSVDESLEAALNADGEMMPSNFWDSLRSAGDWMMHHLTPYGSLLDGLPR